MNTYALSFVIGVGSSIVATIITNNIIYKYHTKKVLMVLLYNTKSILDDVYNIESSFGKLLVLSNEEKIKSISNTLLYNSQNLSMYLSVKELTNINNVLFNVNRIKELLCELKPNIIQFNVLGKILDLLFDNSKSIDLKNVLDNYLIKHQDYNGLFKSHKYLFQELINNCYMFFIEIENFNKIFSYIKVPKFRLGLAFKDEK